MVRFSGTAQWLHHAERKWIVIVLFMLLGIDFENERKSPLGRSSTENTPCGSEGGHRILTR
jgi:hypothetical protein